MSDPSQILKRVRQRRQSVPSSPGGAPRSPAPAPAAGLSPAVAPKQAKVFAGPDAPREPARSPVPRPVGGHALYSELMRSHDRMGTRHLGHNG